MSSLGDKIDEKKVKKLIHSLGLKYNLSDDIIKDIVESPFLFTKQKIKELNLSDQLTEEEFETIKTNFMYRSLGVLFIPYRSVNRMNKQRENINKLNNKKWKK